MTKHKNTTELTVRILAPLVKHCAENRGALTKVTELYNKGLSEQVRISTVQRWLNTTKEDKSRFRSVEPSGGALLRLCEVWIELRGKDCENRKEPTIMCLVAGHQPARDGFTCKMCGCNL